MKRSSNRFRPMSFDQGPHFLHGMQLRLTKERHSEELSFFLWD
jgi:hypothetical protein